MSATSESGEKIFLPRLKQPQMTALERAWAGEDQRRLKRLSLLHNYELNGWTLDQLARLHSHARGTISRLLDQVRAELRMVVAAQQSGKK